jgi:hypothetical protein
MIRCPSVAALASAVWLFAAGGAAAQSCVPEIEPNDEQPATRAGAFCLAGHAQGSDRDIVAWTIDGAGSERLWALQLEALPDEDGRLRIYRAETADDGSSLDEVLSEPVDEGAGELRLPLLLLAPGEYRLAVEGNYGDGLLYRLRTADGGPVPAALPDAVAGAFTGLFRPPADAPARVAWTVDAATAQRLWTLTAQGELGASPTLELYDEQGSRMSRAYTRRGGIATLADLALTAGRYEIRLSGRPGARVLLSAEDSGPLAPGEAIEPNDSPAEAVRFDPQVPVSGRLIGSSSGSDEDYLLLVLDPSWHDQQFDLVLRADSDADLRLELRDARGQTLLDRSGARDVRLPDLVLEPGEHLLRVHGGLDPAIRYTLAAENRRPAVAGREREPNDLPHTPSPFGPDGTAEGRFAGRETDVFVLTVEGEPELWRVEAEGAGLERLILYDTSGSPVIDDRPPSDMGAARLSSLLLVPGRHLFGVVGTDSEYRLNAVRLGPPPAPGTPIEEVLARGLGDELEPNDDAARAMRLEPGVPRTGLLDRAGDVDLYRFHLAANTRVRITLSGPPGSTLQAQPQWGERQGVAQRLRTFGTPPARSEVVWDGILGPGDHYLEVRGEGAAESPYALLVEHRPWFDRPIDLEPNEEWWQASPLPADLRLRGSLFPQDADWYRLPDLERPATLVIRDLAPETGTLAGESLTVVQETPPDPEDPWPRPERTTIATLYPDRQTSEWRGELPAGSGYRLKISSGQGGDYALALDFGDAVTPAPVAPPPVMMALSLETDTVAAFATWGQRVEGALRLENHGAVPLDLALETHVGDERWRIAPAQSRLTLAPGAESQIAVTVEVPPDAWGGRPVTLAVAAFGDTAVPVHVEAVVTPDATAPLVSPYRAWPLPDSMLGGLDVAGAAAGGAMLAGEARLIDGGVNSGTSATLDQGELREALPVIDLAGDDPVMLAGVLLTPAALPDVTHRLRRFAISVSLDGAHFERVLEGTLSARPAEQAFPFDGPVAARFLRLEPIDTHGGERTGSGASLGEIKAVAVPESNPLDPAGIGLNLADPTRGGHIVWSSPLVDRWDLLTAETERPRLYLPSDHDGTVEWVLGFAHNRAAQITAIEWRSGEDGGAPVVSWVDISASLASPVGPWTSLGRFALPPAGATATLNGLQPTWVRYLRFTIEVPQETRQVLLPETLVVREAPVGSGYRSALGEWGELGRDAVHEWLNPPPLPEPEAADANDTPETADLLPFDTPVSGTVLLDGDVDWYRIDVPADGHGLILTLGGSPAPHVALALQDATGTEVPLQPAPSVDGQQSFTAAVAPGPYWLRVEDPPRSVALSWDTSGSVHQYIPAIVQAMRNFAEGLRPEREVVNLFPFRDQATAGLLEEWTGDPLQVFLTLHAYPWSDSSSNAEAALLAASEALAARPGQRAIVLLTDAQSDGAPLTPALWESLAQTRPRIFALAVPGGFTGEELWTTRNLMQDWAGLNGGFYQPMLAQGEIDVAFERLAGWLRRPADYTVTVALDRTPPPPPEPGYLELLAARPDQNVAAPPAPGGILIILDASGSMLQRLDGVRRIEIAKQTLTALTGGTIPPGTMLGLRVFGQGPPESCETELVLPPQPLEPAAIAEVIAGVQPTNLARTPIGESLRSVPQDMAGVTGPQLVVLVTDGEETCDGDPAAEIAALRSLGIDVRVNIVGFALDDPALAETFSAWAALGGGRYFDASDAASLGEALVRAVQRRFTIENHRGRVVASGAIGDPAVALEPGTYTVRVDGGRPIRVTIPPGETVTLAGPY